MQVTLNQALALLGMKTLQLELLTEQCEQIANEYNKVQTENENLKKELEQWRTGQNQQLPTSTPTS